MLSARKQPLIHVNNALPEKAKFAILRGMNSHREIVRAWGQGTLAADLNVPKDRVRGWYRNDGIPEEYWRELLNKAPERNISITGELLINLAARN